MEQQSSPKFSKFKSPKKNGKIFHARHFISFFRGHYSAESLAGSFGIMPGPTLRRNLNSRNTDTCSDVAGPSSSGSGDLFELSNRSNSTYLYYFSRY